MDGEIGEDIDRRAKEPAKQHADVIDEDKPDAGKRPDESDHQKDEHVLPKLGPVLVTIRQFAHNVCILPRSRANSITHTR